MCGINGIVMLKGNRDEETMQAIRYLFDEALVETQDRGHHATGLVAMGRDGEFDFYKSPVAAKVLTTFDDEYDRILDRIGANTASIVSHTRWYTKGKPENNLNNHPFDIGNVVGVHNGTIGNDDELFKKHAEDFSRIAEVDSEIIYQLINHYNKDGITLDGLKEALEKSMLRGQLALAFVHKNQPNLVHIVKQDRPMDFVMWEEAGIVFFNSEKRFIYEAFDKLRRAGKRMGFTYPMSLKEFELKSDNYITLDANAETFDDVFSEPQKLYVISTAVKSNYTASNWKGTGTGTAGNANTATNMTSISAADSIGKVIEGELDTVSGEVIIFTSALALVGENDDGSEMDEDEDGTWCVECGNELQEHEKHAAFNEGAAPSKTYHCTNCHKLALQTVFHN